MFSTSLKRPAATLAAAAALLAAVATATPAHAAVAPHSVTPQSAPTLSPSAASSQGIIMRDGGVCDPIRHMGC
jgi:hypothetical protein